MTYVTLIPETRRMVIPDEHKHFGVESDEKSKRIEFQFPRFVDDIDLNDFNLYINYSNANNEKGLSVAEDVTVSEDEITFAWVLSRHVTEYKGNVNFIVCAKKNFGEFRVQNEWNTRIATADVEQGLEVHHLVESMSSDSINKILSDISLLKPQVESNTLARHTHPNKDVLDRLSDDFGLNYMGSKLATVDYVNMELDGLSEFLGVYDSIDHLPQTAKEHSVALVVDKLSSEPSSISFMQYEYDSWVRINTVTLISNDGIAALNSGVTEEKINDYDDALDELNSISECIPSTASADNLLATEGYVNNSVSTNTAYFRGTFNSVEELEAYAGDVTNNDYAYVIIRDETDSSIVKSIIRYKYAINQWLYEFELSLHDLTPAQIAALLSGITAEKVSTYDEAVSNVDGYSSQNGIPTFNGNNIALEKVDDVAPLPLDEPVNLVFREDCREVAFPVVQDCGAVFNASAYINGSNPQLFNVYAGNGEFVVTATYGPDNFDRTTDGINWADENGNTVQRPTLPGTTISYITFNDEDGVPMYTVSSADPIESQPENIQLAFRQLCQVVNISADAMGTIGNVDFVEAFKGEVEYNRTYVLHLTGDETSFYLPVNRWDIPGVPDGYATVYLTIDQDMDIGLDADYFVGGEVPATTAGVHKLIYNFLPNQQISIGCLDLEVNE